MQSPGNVPVRRGSLSSSHPPSVPPPQPREQARLAFFPLEARGGGKLGAGRGVLAGVWSWGEDGATLQSGALPSGTSCWQHQTLSTTRGRGGPRSASPALLLVSSTPNPKPGSSAGDPQLRLPGPKPGRGKGLTLHSLDGPCHPGLGKGPVYCCSLFN